MNKIFIFFLFPFICLSQAFIHPGLSHKKSDLDRMKAMVAAGKDPWKKSFESLKEHPYASFNYVVQGNLSYTSLDATSADQDPTSAPYNTFKFDGLAAYYNALMWSITGDTRHADKAIEIFNSWVNIKGINSGGTKALDAGRVIWKMLEGAEIIKNTYNGWAPADINAFKDMLVYPGYSTTVIPQAAIDAENASFYWYMYNGDPGRYGNQGLFAWRGVMAMGVFMDNRVMYDRALRYLTAQSHRSDDLSYQSGPAIASNTPNPSTASNPSNEFYNEYNQISPFYSSTITDYGFDDQLQHYFYENGQSQESARDQGHAILGVSLVLSICEIAWNQGDDIYSYNNHRLLKAIEYGLRYNASYNYKFSDQLAPWEPTVLNGEFLKRRSRSGRWESLKINPWNANDLNRLTRGVSFKGDNSPFYELALAHFKDRLLFTEDKFKWTKRVHEISIQESGYEQQGFDVDHSGFGGLTFRRPNLCYGDPIKIENGSIVYAMNMIPGTIEAENFDYLKSNGEGKTFHDSSALNTGAQYRNSESVDIEVCSEGGYNIKDLEIGEWLNYTVSVPSNGFYKVKIRYASVNNNGKIRFEFDGIDKTGDVVVPNGGANSNGLQDWKDLVVTNSIALKSGVQSMRIFIAASSNTFNLNSISIESSTATSVPSAPLGLSASIGNRFVKLNWDESVDANSFNLKRSTTAGGPYSTVASNLTSSVYIDTNLTNDIQYYYILTAVNAVGESPNSVEIVAKPFNNKVILEDKFSSGVGIKINGRSPDFSNIPTRVYEITKTTTSNTAQTNLVTDKGAKLTGPTIGEVFDIRSLGSYTKPSSITISSVFNIGDLTTEVPSRTGRGFFIGFWGSISSSTSVNTYPFSGLRGFMINPDTGKILLWDGSGDVTADFTNFPQRIQNYSGSWIQDQNHSISFTINTTTGKIVDFYLDGVSYLWDQNYVGFSTSNTNYAGFGISSSTSGTSAYISDFAIKEAGVVTVWNGVGWSDGIPNDAKEGVISGNYNTAVNGEFEAKKLIITNGYVFTINSGTSIKIDNELINNSNTSAFVIENGGKLIQVNNVSNTGAITINRPSTPMVRLDYTLWSSPVTSQNLYSFSPSTIQSRFYSYDTSSNNFTNTGLNSSSIFEVAKGYAIRAPNTFTSIPTVFNGEFVGTPNNGVFSVALNSSANGFNLVGNPYPSPIDASEFVNANSSLVNGTLYFYSHNLKSNATSYESGSGGTGMSYATWNLTGATGAAISSNNLGQNTNVPNGIIQVGQGFIVKAIASGNLSFSNSMRLTNNVITSPTSNIFFRTTTSKKMSDLERHRIWLDLSNERGEGLGQILVGYVDGATNEEDNLYDGVEFGDTTTSLSSNLNGKDMIIQGRALPFVDSDVVPLNFKTANSGEFIITLSKMDGIFASSQDVYLKDNILGIVQNLKQSAYAFSSKSGLSSNRFEILYTKPIDATELVNNLSIVTTRKQGVLNVSTSGIIIKDILVFDIQGHLILKQENILNTNSSLSNLPSNSGIFILKVVTDTNKTYIIKVIN
jgi:hypothetical protein